MESPFGVILYRILIELNLDGILRSSSTAGSTCNTKTKKEFHQNHMKERMWSREVGQVFENYLQSWQLPFQDDVLPQSHRISHVPIRNLLSAWSYMQINRESCYCLCLVCTSVLNIFKWLKRLATSAPLNGIDWVKMPCSTRCNQYKLRVECSAQCFAIFQYFFSLQFADCTNIALDLSRNQTVKG